jgi:hypothetical protein
MIESRSVAYLEAMGIEAWTLRPAPQLRDRLVVGPGQGSTLLLCDGAQETASCLASDIARSLSSEPVWAWPDSEQASAEATLEQVVERGLFTTVLIFGSELAGEIFPARPPNRMGSARIRVVSSMERLMASGAARSDLWRVISDLSINDSAA